MPRLSAAQERDRTTYLGATDIAALAGVDPYRTPFDVYLEKIGELDPHAAASDSDRARYERGHRLEDVALDWWADIEGVKIERIHRDVIHPRLPYVIVHPDARVKPWRETRRLVEAKTSARTWDEIPRRVEAQAQMQIAAAKADVVSVPVLGFDGPLKTWEVPRNDELIEALEDLAASAWARIERREPPPIDGSRAASRWLDRMFREGPEVIADGSQAEALARLLRIREEMKRLEGEDRAIVNALKFSMAGAARMYAPKVGRVLWTLPSDRRTVAWKEVGSTLRAIVERVRARAPELVDQILSEAVGTTDLDELESLYTAVAEGVRQFRVSPAKEAPAP